MDLLLRLCSFARSHWRCPPLDKSPLTSNSSRLWHSTPSREYPTGKRKTGMVCASGLGVFLLLVFFVKLRFTPFPFDVRARFMLVSLPWPWRFSFYLRHDKQDSPSCISLICPVASVIHWRNSVDSVYFCLDGCSLGPWEQPPSQAQASVVLYF